MCIICIAPSGTDKYSEFFIKALKISATNNTDGIGFAFKRASTKKVFIAKGFTKIDELLTNIESRKLNNDDELIVHFRIGNKGAKNVDMMHPFVCADSSEEVLQNYKYVNNPVLFHNGTLVDFCGDSKSEFSDTYRFARHFLSNKYIKDLLINEDIEEFANLYDFTLKSNRLAILFPNINKSVSIVGKFIKDNDYLFSNETYKFTGLSNIGGQNYRGNRYLPSSDHINYNHGYDDYEYDGWVTQPSRAIPSSSESQGSSIGKQYKKGEIAVNSRFMDDSDIAWDAKDEVLYCRIGGFYIPEVLPARFRNQFDSCKIVFNKYNYNELVFISKISSDRRYLKDYTYKMIDYDSKTKIHTLAKCSGNYILSSDSIYATIFVDDDELYENFNIRPLDMYENKYLIYYDYLVKNPITKTSIKKLCSFLNTKQGKKDKQLFYKKMENVSRDDLVFIATNSLMYIFNDDYSRVDCTLSNKVLI